MDDKLFEIFLATLETAAMPWSPSVALEVLASEDVLVLNDLVYVLSFELDQRFPKFWIFFLIKPLLLHLLLELIVKKNDRNKKKVT